MSRTHTEPPALAPQEALFRMLGGFQLTQAIAVAAQFGVADRLADGPERPEVLAREIEADAESLYRLLRALAGIGLFAEDDEGRFALTPMGGFLRTDVPGSLRHLAMMMGGAAHWRPWGELAHAVRHGGGAVEKVFDGRDFFTLLEDEPAHAAVFNGAMSNLTAREGGGVVEAYDFGGAKRICDVAGGHGRLLDGILDANPHLHGVLFDRPHVVAGAPAHARREAVGGDFFVEVPAGCDVIVLKHILHDWSDAKCGEILANCHRALPSDGKLLVVEAIVPGGNAFHPSKFLDINMLVMTSGGKERTEAQFAELLGASGFRLARVLPTAGLMSVLESVKA